ncbi:MAG: alpha/beta hydrolase [Bdellovibrionales bacterium]
MSSNELTISVKEAELSAICLDPRDQEKPYIIYHHGLFGSIAGDHCQDALKVAEDTGCGFFAFDNLGHGKTASLKGTVPLEKCNMENWVRTSREVIRKQVPEYAEVILVGNSFGAGVLYLSALTMTQKAHSFLGIGAAPDVISEEIASGLQQYFDLGVLTAEQKTSYEAGEVIYAPFPDPQGDLIPISRSFIEVADTYKVLGNENKLHCPAVLFQGTEDKSLAGDKASRFVHQFHSAGSRVALLLGSDHDLMADKDRAQITQALKSMALQR